MNSELGKIVEEGKQLVEKRSWIRKGLDEVVGKINKELAQIPKTDAHCYFEIERWKDTDEGGERTLKLKLNFENDEKMAIRKGQEKELEWEYENVLANEITIEQCRKIAEELENAMKYFLSEIQAKNADLDGTIEILQNLLKKMI